MEVLNANQILGMTVGLLGIIPTLILYKIYFKTKIPDYLLFSLFFTTGVSILFLDPIAGIYNSLIFFQLHHLAIDLSFLILFVHAIRIIWSTPPRLVVVIGYGWYLVLFILTFSWQVFEQESSALVLFWTLPNSFSSYYPLGAGLLYNNIMIYSTAFRYLGEFYRLFSLSFLIYAYINIDIVISGSNHMKRINLARNLWLIAWSLILIHSITMFPWFKFEIVSIFLIIALLIMVYIALFVPEGLLISYNQLIRINEFYDRLIIEDQEMKSIITTSIKSYLKQVPVDLWDKKSK